MLCFSMKSPRHSATWSNSWNRADVESEKVSQGWKDSVCVFSVLTYSCSTSVHDVFWCVIDLTLHLNGLFLLVAHSDAEDPEVTAAQIQRNEVALLCQTDNVGRREREREVDECNFRSKAKGCWHSLKNTSNCNSSSRLLIKLFIPHHGNLPEISQWF